MGRLHPDTTKHKRKSHCWRCYLIRSPVHKTPALTVLEDLERVVGDGAWASRSAITLQHLLGCLDGLAAQNGIAVVATANDPTTVDPALLKHRGRFERLAVFPLPNLERYLVRLTKGGIDAPSIAAAVVESERMSFAQLREAYILAGQRCFRTVLHVQAEGLMAAIRTVRTEATGIAGRADGRSLGFGSLNTCRRTRISCLPEQ